MRDKLGLKDRKYVALNLPVNRWVDVITLVPVIANRLAFGWQSQLWGSLSRSPIIKSALAGAEIPDTIQLVFWIISLCLLVVIGLIYIAKVTAAYDVTSRRALKKYCTAIYILCGGVLMGCVTPIWFTRGSARTACSRPTIKCSRILYCIVL